MLGVVDREMLAVRSRQVKRKGSHKMRRVKAWRKLKSDFSAWFLTRPLWRKIVLISLCGVVLCEVWYVVLGVVRRLGTL